MTKAKIAFLHGPHDLRVHDVDVPDPTPEEILIRVKAAGICGSDVECYEGQSAEGRYDIAPYTPGHEWSGEVTALGSNVTGFDVGDKVTGDCVMRCFKCENCKRGLMPAACLNFRELGFRPDSPGAFGEYLLLEQHYVHKIPSDWTFEEGALIEPFSVGYYGVWGAGGWVDASDDAVIFGAGPIGLCALIVCKAAKAKVVMVDPLENRRAIARGLGADVVIDPTGVEDFAAELGKHIKSTRGASLVVEASGNDRAIASLFDVAGYQARVRLIGHSVGHKVPVEIGKTIWRALTITGQGGISEFTPRTIAFMERVRPATELTAIVSHRFPFENLQEAMNIAVRMKAGAVKVMLNF
jgi:L-iditol 2-dehydrogenase